ncbi:MAG: CotH kinase family protein [Vicinamibacterales bacterium]
MRRLLLRLFAVAGIGLGMLGTPSAARQDVTPTNVTSITQSDFFSPTKVWTANLTLSADAWRALQPRQGQGGGFGFGGGRFLGPPGGRNGVAGRQGIEFDYVRGTLQIDDWTFRDVAVRYKGNGSYLRATRAGSDKISLKVDLNKHVKGQKLAGLTTINFQNNITDVGWMNEVLAYRLYRDAGALAPRTTYAQVYLTVEGQGEKRYLGLYSISENVDENFADDRFGTKKGAIFKPSTQDLFTDWGANWAAYNQSYDPKTDLTEAQKQRVMAFGRLVSKATDEEFAAQIGDYLDLDDFARYFAVLVWIANHDSLLQNGQNFYTYLHPETNRMHFIAWDQDFSFGNGRNYSGGVSIYSPWNGNNRFLSRVYAVDAFRSKYLARMAELSESLFVPDRFARQVAEIGPAIRPSIALEGKEWLTTFDEVVAGGAGIVPYVTNRATFVRAELTKTAR